MKILTALTLSVLSSLVIAVPAIAQSSPPSRVTKRPVDAVQAPADSATVRLILVEQTGQPGSTIEIIRARGRRATNTMRIATTASARDLAQAYLAFAQMRARVGDDLDGELRAFIRPNTASAGINQVIAAQAAHDLARLTASPNGGAGGVVTHIQPAVRRSN